MEKPKPGTKSISSINTAPKPDNNDHLSEDELTKSANAVKTKIGVTPQHPMKSSQGDRPSGSSVITLMKENSTLKKQMEEQTSYILDMKKYLKEIQESKKTPDLISQKSSSDDRDEVNRKIKEENELLKKQMIEKDNMITELKDVVKELKNLMELLKDSKVSKTEGQKNAEKDKKEEKQISFAEILKDEEKKEKKMKT